jgi:flagellin-like protein
MITGVGDRRSFRASDRLFSCGSCSNGASGIGAAAVVVAVVVVDALSLAANAGASGVVPGMTTDASGSTPRRQTKSSATTIGSSMRARTCSSVRSCVLHDSK